MDKAEAELKVIDGLSYNQSIERCMTNPEKMRGDLASERSEHTTSLLTGSVSSHFDDLVKIKGLSNRHREFVMV